MRPAAGSLSPLTVQTDASGLHCSHFDYISNLKGSVYQRRNYTLQPASFPSELSRKTYLLEYFQNYMAKTLQRDVAWAFVDLDRTKHLDYLVKTYRMKKAIVFKLSNDVIQVRRFGLGIEGGTDGLTPRFAGQINFWDHQKLLLTQNAGVITFIESDLSMRTYSIGALFLEASALGLFSASQESDVADAKTEQRRDSVAFMLSKLECASHHLHRLSFIGVADPHSGAQTLATCSRTSRPAPPKRPPNPPPPNHHPYRPLAAFVVHPGLPSLEPPLAKTSSSSSPSATFRCCALLVGTAEARLDPFSCILDDLSQLHHDHVLLHCPLETVSGQSATGGGSAQFASKSKYMSTDRSEVGSLSLDRRQWDIADTVRTTSSAVHQLLIGEQVKGTRRTRKDVG